MQGELQGVSESTTKGARILKTASTLVVMESVIVNSNRSSVVVNVKAKRPPTLPCVYIFR